MTLVASSRKPVRQVVKPADQRPVQPGCQACGDQVKPASVPGLPPLDSVRSAGEGMV